MGDLVGAMVDLLIGKGAVLENQGMLLRLEKAPFPYPIANIDHNITLLWNNGKLE
jgi:rRNA pseudouridine-1189 N-methylase Emg1 (Nep1/Mra1 family)